MSSNVCNKVLGLASNVFETIQNGVDCVDFLKSDMSIIEGHEGKLIAISEAMVRIALLAWLDKSNDFRDYSLLRYKVTYDGIRSWLELAGPFLDYNNIVIKAYASLTLFEYLHYGTDENLRMLNGSLNRHYGENGGFSEGTGYSLYIWEDVPYILAALKDVYKSQNEMEKFGVSEKFMKSPDYMFDFSRPVGVVGNDTIHYGLIPIEVDDGVTYNPDYRVWAKLKDDPKYLAMTDKYGIAYDKKKIEQVTENAEMAKTVLNNEEIESRYYSGLIVRKSDFDYDSIIRPCAYISWHEQELVLAALDVENFITKKLADDVLSGKIIPSAFGQMPEDYIYLADKTQNLKPYGDEEYTANNDPNRPRMLGPFVLYDNENYVGYGYRTTYDDKFWRWEGVEHSNLCGFPNVGDDTSKENDKKICYWQLVLNRNSDRNGIVHPEAI